jgi:hypothetical protein
MWDACKLFWSLFLGLFRSRASLEAENLALRQQIIVLRYNAIATSLFLTFFTAVLLISCGFMAIRYILL